jgi:hypothetical protein
VGTAAGAPPVRPARVTGPDGARHARELVLTGPAAGARRELASGGGSGGVLRR